MKRWLLTASLLCAGCPAGHRYPDGSGLEGQLERELIALNQEIRLLKAGCTGEAPSELYAEMHQVLAGSEARVSRDGANVLVTVPARTLFSGDGETIREESARILDIIAYALNRHPDHRIHIVGHTNDNLLPGVLQAKWGDKVAFSFHRAHLVAKALWTRFQLAPERFEVAGRGEFQPIASNDTEAGQEQNERVEFRIVPVAKAP